MLYAIADRLALLTVLRSAWFSHRAHSTGRHCSRLMGSMSCLQILHCPHPSPLLPILSITQISLKPAFLYSNIGKLGNGWKICEAKRLAFFASCIDPNRGRREAKPSTSFSHPWERKLERGRKRDVQPFDASTCPARYSARKPTPDNARVLEQHVVRALFNREGLAAVVGRT